MEKWRDGKPDPDWCRPEARSRGGSPVPASRLRIPALIRLLPAGFVAGALTTDANAERLPGSHSSPSCH